MRHAQGSQRLASGSCSSKHGVMKLPLQLNPRRKRDGTGGGVDGRRLNATPVYTWRAK